MVVFRTLTGSVQFKGVLNKSVAKYKVLTEADGPKFANKFKLKFTIAVEGKKLEADKPKPWFVVEHC